MISLPASSKARQPCVHRVWRPPHQTLQAACLTPCLVSTPAGYPALSPTYNSLSCPVVLMAASKGAKALQSTTLCSQQSLQTSKPTTRRCLSLRFKLHHQCSHRLPQALLALPRSCHRHSSSKCSSRCSRSRSRSRSLWLSHRTKKISSSQLLGPGPPRLQLHLHRLAPQTTVQRPTQSKLSGPAKRHCLQSRFHARR